MQTEGLVLGVIWGNAVSLSTGKQLGLPLGFSEPSLG